MKDDEHQILNTLQRAFRSAFREAATDTPYVVVMDQPPDLKQLLEIHDFAREAAAAAWTQHPDLKVMSQDFQGMLYPQENKAPLRWVAYSHEYLAREYAQAMKNAHVESTVYQIELPALAQQQPRLIAI